MKRLAWIIFFVIVAVVIAGLIVNTCHAWDFQRITRGFSYTTPMGVRISASDKAIELYENYWGLSWDDIDWDRLDDWLTEYRQYYGVNMPPPTIRIMPMVQCVEDGPDNYEIRPFRVCCTAMFDAPRTIYIGLMPNNAGIREGQTGQGGNAFCDTALDHELSHYFTLRLDPMPNEVSGYTLGLCE